MPGDQCVTSGFLAHHVGERRPCRPTASCFKGKNFVDTSFSLPLSGHMPPSGNDSSKVSTFILCSPQPSFSTETVLVLRKLPLTITLVSVCFASCLIGGSGSGRCTHAGQLRSSAHGTRGGMDPGMWDVPCLFREWIGHFLILLCVR